MRGLNEQLNDIEEMIRSLRSHLDARLDRNHERQDQMAVDTSKLTAVVEQLKADQAKNSADIQTIIDKLSNVSTDPATQAVIDQAVADLTTISSNTEASNAKAEAAVASST